MQTDFENLKARTKVVADMESYHVRTPANDAWCGADPFGQAWQVVTLTSVEDSLRLKACERCFHLDPTVDTRQDRLEFE